MRKLFVFTIILSILVLAFAGCNTPEKDGDTETTTAAPVTTPEITTEREPVQTYRPKSEDAIEAYEPYIEAYALFLDGDESVELDGTDGVVEAMNYYDVKPGNFGYSIVDMSGDLIPELIITSVGNKDTLNILYSVYTYNDGKVENVLVSTARSRYFLLDGYRLLYEGSANAEQSILGIYSPSRKCTEMNCSEFYFTAADGVYMNTTGSTDTDDSEKTVMTMDDFIELGDTLHSSVKALQFAPFPAVTETE